MTHQPWPGEQLDLYDTVSISGANTSGDIYSALSRFDTSTDITFTAGDEFYILSSWPRLLLSDDPIGECNWLIDVVSGAATVELSTGYADGYSYEPPTPTWTVVETTSLTTGRHIVPLPMGDRTFDRLYNDGLPALHFVVSSGTVVLSRTMLQVEGPDGLLEALTTTPGDWITPPEQTSQAALQQRSTAYSPGTPTASGTHTYNGVYNGEGTSGADLTISPTWLEVVNEARVNQEALSIVTGSWTALSPSDRFLVRSFIQAGLLNTFNARSSFHPLGPGFDYNTTVSGRSILEMKSLWADVTSITSTSGYTGIVGRDTIRVSGQSFDFDGTSHSVGWVPAYLIPWGVYVEERFVVGTGTVSDDTQASPHGDVWSVTGTQSDGHAGSSFPVNVPNPGGPTSFPGTTPTVIPVTPVFGTDIVETPSLSGFTEWAEGVNADWGDSYTDTSPWTVRASSQCAWYWCYQAAPGATYTWGRPLLRVQPPNYREHVPVWTLSPDSVGPSDTETPPFTGTPSGDAHEYTYEGDAGTGVAPPILWFLYKKWGFLGDHVVAYGQGLGNSQAALHGVLKLGPGTVYPVVGDVTPTIVSWTVSPAGTHAYDGTGVIFPGTDTAPPHVDAEVQVIEFIVPTGYPLDAPTSNHVYVENDNGRSNALQLLLYPMVDIDMASPDPDNVSYTASMGIWDPADAPALAQHYSLFTLESTVLSGRVPERAPLFLGAAAPACTFTGGVPTSGLDDPVDIAIPLLLRYRPLDSKITPRPDLGTGISVWDSNETSSMDWKFHVDSAPFVDSSAEFASRNGSIVRPALVFPGDAWCETTNGFAAGPTLTCVMVVKVYPDAQERSYLLSSFVSGTPDPDTFPLEVFVTGDQVCLRIGGRLNVTKIPQGYIGQRPIIVGISLNANHLTWAVVAATGTVRDIAHAPMTSAGLKLYLGRSNDAGNLQMATMDVLDMSLDVAFKATNPMWTIINRFDSAYGVMA